MAVLKTPLLVIRGRLGGRAGAGSSYSGLPSLPGGVLKGDDPPAGPRVPGSSDNTTGLAAILGLSARLIGGGVGLRDKSLLISTDLLGGGGEGGLAGRLDNEGDLPTSTVGVCGLLGSLNWPGEDLPDVAEIGLSVER